MRRYLCVIALALLLGSCSGDDLKQASTGDVLEQLATRFDVESPSENVEDYYADLWGPAFNADEMVIRTIDGQLILLLAKDGGYSSSDQSDLADQIRDQVVGGAVVDAIVYRGVAIIVTDDVDRIRQALEG